MVVVIAKSLSHYEEPHSPYTTMISLGVVVVLPCILAGMAQNFSAVALPQMNLSIADASWFASVGGFSAPIGTILLGIVIDVFGRRTTLMLGIIPHFIGWSLILYNYNITVTLIGRISTGLTTGILFYPAQVYAAECITVNKPHLRSNFSTWPAIANAVGIFLTFLLSCFVDYLTLCLIAIIFSILFFVLIFIFIPESPTWLHINGRMGDAEISEKKLGICQPILKNSKITKASKDDSQSLISETFKFQWSDFQTIFTKLKRKDVLIPLILTTILKTLVVLNGGNVLLSYMVSIIGNGSLKNTSASTETLNSYEYSVISGVLILIARFLACFMLPMFGFKKFMIWTSLSSAISMFLIGYTATSENTPEFDWYSLHVIAVWLATFLFNFGASTLPAAVLGDTFPVDAKGFASIPILTALVTTAVVIKLYPYLYLYYGALTYYGYATAGVLCAIFVHFCMPEIVGRTLEQINKEYVW